MVDIDFSQNTQTQPLSIGLATEQVQVLLTPNIGVIGVGGAGGNAINNMIESNLQGVSFFVANTDAQALAKSLAPEKIQLGISLTRGLGAGSNPEIGKKAAEESEEKIKEYLTGLHLLFITAGMGGGTGTGAAPVIAKIAHEMGILTVAVVSKPFNFEGTKRMQTAEGGILELQKYVETLLLIPNQNMFRVIGENTTFKDAFKIADNILCQGVRSITDLMMHPGFINLDFADVQTVLKQVGRAMMGSGEASGENRALVATEKALTNPLLDDSSIKGAKRILINVAGGDDMTLAEVANATERVTSELPEEASIIFGTCTSEELTGKIRVTIVATGIQDKEETSFKENQEPQKVQERLNIDVPSVQQPPEETVIKENQPEFIESSTTFKIKEEPKIKNLNIDIEILETPQELQEPALLEEEHIELKEKSPTLSPLHIRPAIEGTEQKITQTPKVYKTSLFDWIPNLTNKSSQAEKNISKSQETDDFELPSFFKTK